MPSISPVELYLSAISISQYYDLTLNFRIDFLSPTD